MPTPDTNTTQPGEQLSINLDVLFGTDPLPLDDLRGRTVEVEVGSDTYTIDLDPAADLPLERINANDMRILRVLDEAERRAFEAGGDVPEAASTLLDHLQDALDASAETIQEKVSRYGYVVDSLQADADALDARAEAWEERAETIRQRAKQKRKNADRLTQRVKNVMESQGIDEIEAGDYHVRLAKRRGARRTKMLVDAETLPPRFQRKEVRLKYKGHEVDGENADALASVVERLSTVKGVAIKETVKPDKRSLKSAYKNGDEDAQGLMELEERPIEVKWG